MKTIDWKDKYANYDNVDVSGVAIYLSVNGSAKSGTGTREIPYPANVVLSNKPSMIIGNGVFNINHSANWSYSSLTGNSMTESILNTLIYSSGSGSSVSPSGISLYCKNLTVKNINTPTGGGRNIYARYCILDNMESTQQSVVYNNIGGSITNCIQKGRAYTRNSNNMANIATQCSFVSITSGSSIYDSIRIGQSLFAKTAITVDQAMLTGNYTYYTAFNGCSFAIGAEVTATPLTGANAVELRANFVSRCVAQGLTVPTVTEFGNTTSVGRWIFSNTSIAGEYDTLQDSEIDVFAKLRGIYFGHINATVNRVPITATLNIPSSFNTQTPVKDALVAANSIGLLATSDITKRVNAYADSKIIWLGGLCKLSTLALTHNLPIEAGVAPDSVYGLDKNKTLSGSIIANAHYIIRSNNDLQASVKYNNVQYTSSLITHNNVFLGVTGITAFEDLTGNSELYQVLDFANHSSMQVRLMREIPTGNITSGNLQAGYWYFVEPNNLSDPSGTITYKGVVRPAFDSFLVDVANLTFTVNGTCHLRRCWKQDFNYATETTDKAFWTDRQKPNYFDVVSDDLRCLLKNNSSASIELQTSEDGIYIGSGHPEFYNNVNGINGLKVPAYNIVGTYLQIRVPITTINPM